MPCRPNLPRQLPFSLRWQAASEVLYKAAAEKAQAGKAEGGSTSSASSGESQDAGKKDEEGPIIDAEVVDEKKG